MTTLSASAHGMSKTEHDGFGFVAHGDGKTARGRYIRPGSFCGFGAGLPSWLIGEHAEENRIPKTTTGLIVHGRTSTNVQGLENVHPFRRGSQYLAHNGVLHWMGSGPIPTPKCDSEQLLQWLSDDGELDKANQAFAGYGAIAILNEKSGVVTIAKSHGAKLFIARRAQRAGWVFATTENLLISISEKAGIRLDTPPLIFPEKIITIKSGIIAKEQDWTGFALRPWTALDDRAFGMSRPQNMVKHQPKWITKHEPKELFPDYKPEVPSL